MTDQNPTRTSAQTCTWNALQKLADDNLPSLANMFANSPQRAKNYSLDLHGLYVDFSKQKINDAVRDKLLSLAKSADLETWRAKFFAGDKINTSEDRAVLHPALRGASDDKTIEKQVSNMLGKTRAFANQVRNEGQYKAIVHIGIGGSDLGPRLCAHAFAAQKKPDLDLRFAVNVDGASINDALDGLAPKTTLVIIVSKSFTTQETRMNGEAAKDWLGSYAKTNMVAISANSEGAKEFGAASVFDFWDWVGGRFSLWCAVSLSLQIAYGTQMFDDLLAGAQIMDTHFRTAPFVQNMPVMMALVGIWNRNFLGYDSLAIIPYSARLAKLPSFLQQLEMESNGKAARRGGGDAGLTCPTLWGDEGTNSQHAFFQHLHQSKTITPVDFIAVLSDSENRPSHHRALLANCIAQSEALMVGNDIEDVKKDLASKGLSQDEVKSLAPQKTFSGNRPSTTIALDTLDAKTLGMLIALYEHKVFVQSVIWDINAFDQWGVQLGKVLAGHVLADLSAKTPSEHDSSTNALIALARKATKS